MHHLGIKNPRRFLSSGTFGTVDYGLPAAIGAKTVRPDMDVMCITSDRGFQMVIQEIATSLTDDLPVTVVILNSGTLGTVRQWQKLFWSERYSATTLKCDPDFVKMAEAFSAKGIHVEKPGKIQDALMEVRGRGKDLHSQHAVNPDGHVLPMIPADSKENIVTGRCSFRIRTRFLLTGVEEGIPLPLLFLVGSPDYSEVLETDPEHIWSY